MIGEPLYAPVRSVFKSLGEFLSRQGINPSHLTLFGLLTNIIGACFYAYGHFVTGSLIILFAGLFDMMDGSVARSSGKETKFGAFIDSVIDRYSDFFIFGGLLMFFARIGRLDLVCLVLFVLAGAILTSYTKARAENFIKECRTGWIARPERIFVICAGGLFGFMVPALWFLAVTAHITALQRIFFTWKNTEGKRIAEISSDPKLKHSPQRGKS